jgi:hypothetical protein
MDTPAAGTTVRYISPEIVDYGSITDLTLATTGFPGLSAGCIGDCGPPGGGGGNEGGGGSPGGGGTPGGGIDQGGSIPGGGGPGDSGGGLHTTTTTPTTTTSTTTHSTTTTTPTASGHGDTASGPGGEVAGAQTTSSGAGGPLALVGAVASGALPFTGFPTWAAVLIGIVLLMVGLLLLRVTRRRRSIPVAPVLSSAAPATPVSPGTSTGDH